MRRYAHLTNCHTGRESAEYYDVGCVFPFEYIIFRFHTDLSHPMISFFSMLTRLDSLHHNQAANAEIVCMYFVLHLGRSNKSTIFIIFIISCNFNLQMIKFHSNIDIKFILIIGFSKKNLIHSFRAGRNSLPAVILRVVYNLEVSPRPVCMETVRTDPSITGGLGVNPRPTV
jgi:hypothetical protein